MRLIDLLSPAKPACMLMEHIIVNIEDVKEVVRRHAEFVDHPTARTWFSSQLLSFLVNRMSPSSDDIYAVQPSEIKSPPPWMRKELEAGQPAYHIKITNLIGGTPISNVIQNVIIWLNLEFSENPPSRISLTWEQAAKKVQEEDINPNTIEHIRQEREMSKPTHEPMKGENVVMEFPDGFRWVSLSDVECREMEGVRMANCLKDENNAEEYDILYSLRDKNYKSRMIVGAEEIKVDGEDIVDRTEITTIEGRGSTIPKKKYSEYLMDLINKFDLWVDVDMQGYSHSITDVLMHMEIDYDAQGGGVMPYGKVISIGTYGEYDCRALYSESSDNDIIVVSSEKEPYKAIFPFNDETITDFIFIENNKTADVRLANLSGYSIYNPLKKALAKLLMAMEYKVLESETFLIEDIAEMLDVVPKAFVNYDY